MRRLFVDTSAWFAYVNRGDREHPAVAKVFQAFEGRLITSNFVFDEVVTLCGARLGWRAAEQVGDTLLDRAVVDLVRLTARDEGAAWTLFRQRSDKTYSFTDCTSFTLMHRLRLRTALALDHHFWQEGFEVLPEEGSRP